MHWLLASGTIDGLMTADGPTSNPKKGTNDKKTQNRTNKRPKTNKTNTTNNRNKTKQNKSKQTERGEKPFPPQLRTKDVAFEGRLGYL